ncbi:MAG TPA: hypothetical protein DCR35_01080 [Runella sp.]|nr:hypothetical protein [Runella sp.]HAO48004.1 hypothetical protein [Runella sp.]
MSRIAITAAAARVIDTLRAKYGALMFYQSGGCCDYFLKATVTSCE